MSYIKKATVTLTGSTTAGASAYTTDLNGFLLSIHYIQPATLPLSTKRTIVFGRGSSNDMVLTCNPPSSTNLRYAPRDPIYSSTGSTAAVKIKSTAMMSMIPFANEKLKLCVNACSSAGDNAVFDIYIGG